MKTNNDELKQFKIETYEDHLKFVELRMGMTLPEFHTLLRARSANRSLLRDLSEKIEILEEWFDNDEPIVCERTGDIFVPSEGEFFVPCYCPDVPVLNEMPTRWFYSNYCNLLSVGKKKVKYVMPTDDNLFQDFDEYIIDDDTDDPEDERIIRGSYKWKNPITDKIKTIKPYNLGTIIFNPEYFYGVREELKKTGSYAFYTNKDPYALSGHHTKSIQNDPQSLYDYRGVMIYPNIPHKVAEHSKLDNIDEIDMMRRFSTALKDRTDKHVCGLLTEKEYDKEGNLLNHDHPTEYRDIRQLTFNHPEEWESLVNVIRSIHTAYNAK